MRISYSHKTRLVINIVIGTVVLIYPSVTYAITMQNESYQINSTINYSPSANVVITDKTDLKSPQKSKSISGTNYTVTYGFTDIPTDNYFALKNNRSEILFGTITPGEALERSISLTIIPGSSTGYQIFALENYAPKDKNIKASIPDTTCDNGNCTNTLTDTWNNPLTYGFGFRCNGISCSNSFIETDTYRKLPNTELGDSPQAFASLAKATSEDIKLNFKINISGSQPKGVYSNEVLILASPLF